MKLGKAIELLNIAKGGWPVRDAEDYYKALELGIEALKVVEKLERRGIILSLFLPGETK